jgi:P-type Na+/K+ transporter
MMLVLLLALGVSLGIGSYIEGGVVGAVVALNIVVGFLQEYSAEKTMESLRGLSSPSANVIRSGHAKQVPSPELVPGDVVEVLYTPLPLIQSVRWALTFCS